MKVSKEELQRFWRRIKHDGECWIWTGAKRCGRARNGNTQWYSTCTFKSKNESVHRLFYWAYKGKIAKGLELDHLCRNTLCVNPLHLEAVSHSENVKRGTAWNKIAEAQSIKTHCPQGHEYSKENTYEHNGQRHCKECVRKRSREYQRRRFGYAAKEG